MEYVTRKTSHARFWTGVDAAIYDTSGGFLKTARLGCHSVRMHLDKPVVAMCRCDGVIQRRVQGPGDIDVIPAGFSAAWHDAGPTTVLIVNIDPVLVRSAAGALGLDADRVSLKPQLQLRDPRLEHILWALKTELESEDSLGRLYADSLGFALITHLLRRFAQTAHRRSVNGLSSGCLDRVIDYIEENLTRDLTLAELAGIAHLSPSHFKTLFKESVGVPVHQYVVQTRVKRATKLLTRGDARLSDVALEAGFANQSHMARCMRRVMGTSPHTVKRSAS